MYKSGVSDFEIIVVLLILIPFELSTCHPFVFESHLNTCSYKFSRKKTLIFTSKLWKVESGDIVIYYTLCGPLPQEVNCGLNTSACLIEKGSNSRHVLGKNFTSGKPGSINISLEATSADVCESDRNKYKFSIKFFDCDEGVQEPRLQQITYCQYVVYMVNPKCSFNCATSVNEELIDLGGLKGHHFVESQNINFSLALCGDTRKCYKNDASICAEYNGSVLPLSSSSNERILYNLEKNEIVYRGSYKGTKKFEMLLKCSWEEKVGPITHRQLSTQGKEYKFIMETSYGCVKLPPTCVVNDGSFYYNITDLFRTDGYQVNNVPKGSIYLNVCGPLKFDKQSENSCSRSFSQVCEFVNGNYINRGSIMSKLTVDNDVVRVTYSHGMKCKKDPSKQYATHIDLICSKTDDRPMFVMANDCDLFINWRTTLACPRYGKTSCDFENTEHNVCSVVHQGQYYDLSPLKLSSKSYEIVDPKNNNIKYYLNICDPVRDADVPCMTNSMVLMKNMSEINLKYRTKSLGQMGSISVVNDEIVVETLTGTYCGAEGDYTSIIHLVCDMEEKLPELLNRTECRYEFRWRTIYACSNESKMCSIRDHSSGTFLDFSKSRKTSLKLSLDQTDYLFDICKNNYKECSANGGCNIVPLTKTLTLNNSTSYLELTLPKQCNAQNVINKVVFQLVCDEFENNEYFKRLGTEIIHNCTVKLLFHTNIVCSRKGYPVDVKEKEKYVLDESDSSTDENVNCSVTAPTTGYKIYLSSLDLNIPMFSCPSSLFYEHNRTVVLIYPSTSTCEKFNTAYEYRVTLQCSSREFREIKKMDCREQHQLAGAEFCKIFAEQKLAVTEISYAAPLGIALGVMGVIACLGVCIYCRHRGYNRLRRFSHFTMYEKDGDI